MLDMAPPYDAPELPVAGIGHNSRQYEIMKAAEEIRSAYLKNNLREGTSTKWKILHVANVSGMSDAAFRQLFTYLAFGNKDCDNLKASNRTVAMLLQKGERAVQRVNKELEENGWLSGAKHQGPKEPMRSAEIPEKVMSAIVFEMLGASKTTGVTEVPNLSPLSKTPPQEEAYPRQTCRSTPVKNDARTYKDNLDSSNIIIYAREEPADAKSLVEEDFVEYHKLFNLWGKKPNDITPCAPWMRSFTDDNLRSVLRSQAKHPVETVVSAVRMTIVSMQARATLGEYGRYGAGSFGSYFQQELIGTIRLLLSPREQKPPPTSSENFYDKRAIESEDAWSKVDYAGKR